jgi:hypothetical protein
MCGRRFNPSEINFVVVMNFLCSCQSCKQSLRFYHKNRITNKPTSLSFSFQVLGPNFEASSGTIYSSKLSFSFIQTTLLISYCFLHRVLVLSF